MRRDQASRTAAWVAACRGLGSLLPDEARLCDDPWGTTFGGVPPALERGRVADALRTALPWAPPVLGWVLYLQVRTRVIDDALLTFVRGGGRQVLLLGAGFDCRAARFRDQLAGVTLFEVDHPATQARKREVLGAIDGPGPRVEYLPWDFEANPLDALPAALAGHGFDRHRPVLTIWEGVTMYLTEPAIEATVAAVRGLSAPGSVLVFTYFDRAHGSRSTLSGQFLSALVAGAGEPFRWGWDPAALPAWLAERGWALDEDRDTAVAAQDLLPASYARHVRERGRRIAVARVAPAPRR